VNSEYLGAIVSSVAEKASTPTPENLQNVTEKKASTPTPNTETVELAKAAPAPPTSSSPASSGQSLPESNSQFDEAINLIQKIRTRYLSNNGVFREFLTILNEYK